MEATQVPSGPGVISWTVIPESQLMSENWPRMFCSMSGLDSRAEKG